MIYEIRSYQVAPENVPEFERRFGAGYVDRAAFSPLTAFWRTNDQALSEVIHVWPYQDQAERTIQRARAAEHPNWPPATGGFVNRMMVELVLPFDFVEDRRPGTVGPVFEIQYDYFQVSDLRAAGEAWSNAIEDRSQHDSLVLAGRLEFGQTNGIVQIWAFPNEERRGQGTSGKGAWRPVDGPVPTSSVVKQLSPSTFSPLQ
ncbi:NIPSNAP family protein [Arthrobacter sp. I2-34]|uniref:NIPSNAP family protein n=1 Tax=Arthrobacter hankyongi TaxID=2904801 RepID=A0ABS9L8V9_9MICC|nr:NIPSNAP family protein [Arthrobacter hankyongi]MCG2623117.1 NIPSNAP family protein [Arthrobacter hankyongi]